MAHGIEFEGANKLFGKPVGETEDRVSALAIFDNGVTLTSCWELSSEELAEIQRTGRVWVSLWSRGLCPLFIGSETTVREVNADNGIWKRPTRPQPQEEEK